MRIVKTLCLLVGLILLLAACASGSLTANPATVPATQMAGSPTSMGGPSAAMTMAPGAATPAQGTVSAGATQQVAAGQQGYSQSCAVCHGADLQGGTGPSLGPQYVALLGNAGQLVDFTARQMPLTAPGSLTQQQYYDIVAFILDKDGLLPAGTTLTTQNASTIQLTAPQQTTPTGSAATTATPAVQQPVMVAVARIPSVGNVLVDSQGFSLYYNTNDEPAHSTCTGQCADQWPPLMVPQGAQPATAPGVAGQIGVFQRPDGTYQVTYTNPPNYDQVPLYSYFNDIEPGDRNGNLLYGTWYNIVLSATTGTVTPGPAVPGRGVAALGVADYLLNCSTCHGIEGQGVDAPPLRNSQYIQTAGDQAIYNVIVNGFPGTQMPAWLLANGGPLVAAQINNIVAYLHTLQGVSPVPPVSPAPPEPTETPLPPGAPTPEPARPSESGGPGTAATLTGNVDQGRPMFGSYCALCHGPEGVLGISNPDTDDLSVPPLNPIDPTLIDPDPKIFAVNVDLFIEHGSIPEGEGPLLLMPPFGDSNMLTQQQIADIIAYVISLNSVTLAGTPVSTATPGPAFTATLMPTPPAQATVTGAAAPQVAAGQQVYTQDCAVCHGANLQGVSGPPLAQSAFSFLGNAKALLDFISQQMPLSAPGSLSAQQFDDVTAFILDRNGLLPSGTTLTAQNAATISLTAPAAPTPTPAGARQPDGLHDIPTL
jgi:mono/diheme cytochrome c family protein